MKHGPGSTASPGGEHAYALDRAERKAPAGYVCGIILAADIRVGADDEEGERASTVFAGVRRTAAGATGTATGAGEMLRREALRRNSTAAARAASRCHTPRDSSQLCALRVNGLPALNGAAHTASAMLVNGTHVRRLDLDGKAAAEPPFAAEMRDHTFLSRTRHRRASAARVSAEGQSASGTADDPVIIENMDIDVRKYPKIPGLTLMWAHHILVRNVRVRHAPTGIGIRLKKSHNARFENVEVLACEPDQGYGLPACSPRTLRKQPVGPNPTKDGYNIRCEESQWSHSATYV